MLQRVGRQLSMSTSAHAEIIEMAIRARRTAWEAEPGDPGLPIARLVNNSDESVRVEMYQSISRSIDQIKSNQIYRLSFVASLAVQWSG